MAKIPHFSTDEEAATFWERHDLADFSDELETAPVSFAKAIKQVVSVRLDPEDLELLKTLAADQGVGHSTLARMWVKERLQQLRSPSPRRRKLSG